jgi:hypothetical protein
MQGEATSRIQKIRSAVQVERSLLHSFEQSILDENTRKHLIRTSTNLLDDVENFFLNLTVLQEPRSPSDLANWLGQAEKRLRWAVESRKFAERIVKQFGPTVRVIAG